MLTCCTCQEVGFNRNSLEMHIASTHVFYNAYECEHCKTAQFPSEFALRQHYQQDHRQKNFYIRFRVSPDLEKKREVLETLIRKSIANSTNGEDDANNRGDSTNMNDTTPGFIPNIDHLEASQLLNSIQAGPTTTASSFSALLKYEEAESSEGSANDLMLTRNGDAYGCPITYSTAPTAANGKAVTAVQGLLSMNGNGIQVDPHQHQQIQHQHQQLHGHIPHQFMQIPGCYGNASTLSMVGGNDAVIAGEMSTEHNNGSDLLAKLLSASKPVIDSGKKRNASPMDSGKRPPRVSTQIQCVECNAKVSNYMNSLVLHVSTHHCDLPVYECMACNKQWFSLSARYKDHIKSRHDGNMSLLKDNRQSMMPLLKEKAVKLFPQHRFT